MVLFDVLPQLTWALLATLALSIFFWAWVSQPRITRNGQPLRKPIGTNPVLGNGLVFLKARHKLFDWFSNCERHFGLETFEISVPTLPPGVVINNPDNLDYVFRNEAIFQKGELFRQLSWDLFGNGIINADGPLWKAQRKAGLHFLSAENLKVLNTTALPRYLDNCVQALTAAASSSVHGMDPATSVVDLQNVFHEITSQLMGNMAYGMEMHSGDDFTAAFEHASGCTTERFQNPLWFVTELITGARFRKSLQTVQSVGQTIVENALKRRAPAPDPILDDRSHNHTAKMDSISGSLIYSLIDALGEDKKLVADAALNYLSAGRDTVAQALTWTMYLLMQHESAKSHILEEALEIRAGLAMDDTKTQRPAFQHERLAQPDDGEHEDSANTSEIFTPTTVSYAMAVFYESLRLYPPIPFEIKQCTIPATLPDGTELPQGAIVFWSPWSMNRSRDIWGPDADTFRPERWLVQEEDGQSGSKKLVLKTRSAAEFPVFNGGQRLCLGKRMAELMAAQIIPTLVEKFDFVPAFDLRAKRISGSSLTLPMQGGLPCTVVLRG